MEKIILDRGEDRSIVMAVIRYLGKKFYYCPALGWEDENEDRVSLDTQHILNIFIGVV